jgi:aryl-alcohol dehydrogenase-like predicted oxidoreductase
MRYQRLGSTGLNVSELCLGAMTFGHKFGVIGTVGQDEANVLVRTALDAGVNFFDTAEVYSLGESEEILGEALRTSGVDRTEVVVATKVSGRPPAELTRASANGVGQSRKHIREACDASLRRLGLDYIDLYQTHRYDAETPLEETLDALNDLVRAGKVLYVGCSNIPPRHLARALGQQREHDWAHYVSLQAYYSLVGREIELELLPLCREEGLGVMVWSPLSGGFLSGKYRPGGSHEGRRTEYDFPPVAQNAEDVFGPLEEIASAHGVSLATISLAWLRDQPGISSVILGASKPEQLRENLSSADVDLSADELEHLGSPTRPAPIYPEWMLKSPTVAPQR